MDYRPAPTFLDVGPRRLFITHYASEGGDTKPILLLPPFAEEMNRVRRYVAELSKQLLRLGYTLWTVDLSCTGDSSGKFSAARVADWKTDLVSTIEHIAPANRPLDLLAIRGGALFVPSLLRMSELNINKICMLEPISTGGQLLNEFLRIRVAKSVFEGTKETVSSLATLLEDGDSVEVAGYKLSSGLYHELLELSLEGQSFKPRVPGLVIGCLRALTEARQRKLVHTVSEWNCPENVFDTLALQTEPFWANELAKIAPHLNTAITDFYSI